MEKLQKPVEKASTILAKKRQAGEPQLKSTPSSHVASAATSSVASPAKSVPKDDTPAAQEPETNTPAGPTQADTSTQGDSTKQGDSVASGESAPTESSAQQPVPAPSRIYPSNTLPLPLSLSHQRSSQIVIHPSISGLTSFTIRNRSNSRYNKPQ